jgi:4-amino-4-deoxy-L-arabinose transferase-like glycosyltransferase
MMLWRDWSSFPEEKRYRIVLAALILVSLVLRLAGAFYLGNEVVELPGTADQISYNVLAQRVLTGHSFTFAEGWWPATKAGEPTAHWSYLYTLYLMIVYQLFGINPLVARLIQAALTGFLQPLLTYWIARRVFDPIAGLLAAAINAIYLYYIYYAGTLMTEPFYITAILGSLYIGMVIIDQISPHADQKEGWPTLRSGLFLGICLGCAVLLRQLFLLIVPFLLIWIAWAGWRRKNHVPLKALLASLVVLALMILPFTIFNYLRFHRFVLLNTNAGYAFFWANHPIYGTHFEPILRSASYIDLIPPELLGLDEVALEQALLKRGLQFVVDDPGRYLLLSLSRIPAYFMFWPSNESSFISNLARVGSFGLFLPFMLAGIVLAIGRWAVRQRQAPSAPETLLLLFVTVYSGIHLLSWSLVRYRLPVDAALIPFAGFAVQKLFGNLGQYPFQPSENGVGK